MQQLINTGQIKKLKTVAKGGIFLAAVLCFFVCLFSFNFVQAQPLDTGLAYAEQTGLPTTDIREIIANIIRVALGLLGIIAIGIILYGGWLWMTAGGNEEQIERAKKTLINGTVGLAIILSAYSIVLFVMRLLGIGGGEGDGGQYAYQPPGIVNMTGSGAWGKVITDHYPTRGQKDVPRNTKIAITFAKPINLASVATQVQDGEQGTVLVLNTSAISLKARIPSSTASSGFEEIVYPNTIRFYGFPVEVTLPSGATTTELYTIVLEPQTLLGDREKDITYAVRINNNVQTMDNKSVFANTASSYYEWLFTCGTLEDNDPPYVVDIYPGNGEVVPKNATIQITFNEPIFPNAQASFATSSNGLYYQDKTNGNYPIVFIKSGHSSMPLGTFKITNQYRTLEFASSLLCGTNACGLPIYCLPACDLSGCSNNIDDYEVVFKTAPTTTNPNKPKWSVDLNSAQSGVMDMAGNAMDANHNNIYERNTAAPFAVGFSNPDNYGWAFKISTDIDRSSPYIMNLSIGPETEMVLANDDLNILWSKRMKFLTLYSMAINEHPSPENRCSILKVSPCSTEPLGKSPSSSNYFNAAIAATTTYTQILHTPFLDGLNIYYLPEITSAVEDINGNCFYPGKGPSITSGAYCDGPYCCNGEAYNDPYSATCTIRWTSDYPTP